MRTLARLILISFQIVCASGCGLLPFWISENDMPFRERPPRTRATALIDPQADLKNGVFLGIAMSGGGSRAANFSAAALLELEKMKILEKATVISSVSGSSLTAGYYGLFGDKSQYSNNEIWSREEIRKRLVTNFESEWFARWFIPWNVPRYWLTGFDRSDIMKDVFDHNLFSGKTFGDMPKVTPKILINSTSLTGHKNFIFTDEEFDRLGSNLSAYPVSSAVMASGAFPGAFHNVTVHDYTNRQQFVHLFDGGPSDNLGVETLREVAQQFYAKYNEKDKQLPCFMIIVDAYAEAWRLYERDFDTRKWYDFLFDTNALEASDVLLSLRRRKILDQLDLTMGEKSGQRVYSQFDLFTETDIRLEDKPELKQIKCRAWLITFQRLTHVEGEPHARALSAVVNNIPTRYTLLAPHGLGAQQAQDALFESANMLIRRDKETLKQVCIDLTSNYRDLICP
jgi:predicted acylesterase/phospholipase RssA